MLSRVDIPLRLLLVTVVGGAYATLVVGIIYFLATGQHLFSTDATLYPLAYTLFFGLFIHAASLHSIIPPWRRHWDSQLESITRQIAAITGDSPLTREDKWAYSVYKTWMESLPDLAIRAHIHYMTGVFYTLVAVSLISAVGAALSFVLYCSGVQIFIAWDYWRLIVAPDPILQFGFAVCAGLLAFACYRKSVKSWLLATETGMIAMHLQSGADHLRLVARATDQVATAEIDSHVVENAVRSAVALFKPVCVNKIESVKLENNPIDQYDLRDDSIKRICHITVTTSDPETINGRANLYNGPLQKEIAHEVRIGLAHQLNVQDVRLQIKGTSSLTETIYQDNSDKSVDMVDLGDAVETGIIRQEGAVWSCCQKFGVSKIILRNGRIVGPSPGLATVLTKLVKQLPKDAAVYDPFAGTRLTERLCRQVSRSIRVVANDRVDLDGHPTGFDAFNDVPAQHFDVVVVDPFYEDVLLFLQTMVTRLDYRYLVVQTGDCCDRAWNEAVDEVLGKLGAEVSRFNSLETFGKRIRVIQRTTE